MKIILRASCDDEYYNCECNFAFVNLTEEYAKELYGRYVTFMKAKEADNDLVYFKYWDGGAQYLSDISDEDESIDGWEDMGDDFEPDAKYMQRTDCDMVTVSDRGVYWNCIPKHSSVRVETDTVSIAALKEISKL